ncbi:MAG: HAMP domain-containing sensor histidine kinase [Saprospiraceae bacterium]|nr:HAMP domain-containing sensor histidine kinase [Saprospiraceae bacterium]
MQRNLIQRLVILGGLVIIGILSTQSYWLLKTWDLKDQEFDLTVRKVLLKVSQRIANFNNFELPKKSFIERTSSNYYVVNINSGIDANILEDYLYQEMGNFSLRTDFEYSVFDCTSKEMVYGNYCDLSDEDKVSETNTNLPIFTDLDYYFVVRFPSRESFVLANMRMTVLFSIIAILSVLFFLYMIYIVLKQKRLSELQKDFINNMTHEFKTPISSIKIAADVLSNNENVKSDSRLKRYASIITEQNQRLNDQVEKVLNIARLEKDNFELKKENIDVNGTLANIVQNESVRLKEGKISLDFKTDNIEILADPLHFTNVITTVLDNAIKYSPKNPNIEFTTEQRNNLNIIQIKDNGIGIEKDKLKQIFDKFYRVSTGDVHNVKGFGLGLFYVKNICNAHGWIIDAQSELGVGTTFIIKIPVKL